MGCCSTNDFDNIFDKRTARKELKAYLKKGPNKRTRKLADFLKGQGIAGSTVVEIGSGIGALHLQLLKEGAKSATGIDASSAYVEATTTLAERLGLQDVVEYHVGDFVEKEQDIPPADIVLLDRVICCYPDMQGLVSASGRHAQRLYAMSYPPRNWVTRALAFIFNASLTLLRKRFRAFIHNPDEVASLLASLGLTRIFRGSSGVWQLAVYRRQ